MLTLAALARLSASAPPDERSVSADAIKRSTVGLILLPFAPTLKKYSAAVASAGTSEVTACLILALMALSSSFTIVNGFTGSVSSKPSAAECARRVDVASRLLRLDFAQSASRSSQPPDATQDDAPVWNPLKPPFRRANDPSQPPTVDQRLAARRQVARSSAELISCPGELLTRRWSEAETPRTTGRLGGSVKTQRPQGRVAPVRTPLVSRGRTIGPVVPRLRRRAM